MTINKVNPNGWHEKQLLTTAQMNQLDSNSSYGIDKRAGQSDTVESTLTYTGNNTFEGTVEFRDSAIAIENSTVEFVDSSIQFSPSSSVYFDNAVVNGTLNAGTNLSFHTNSTLILPNNQLKFNPNPIYKKIQPFYNLAFSYNTSEPPRKTWRNPGFQFIVYFPAPFAVAAEHATVELPIGQYEGAGIGQCYLTINHGLRTVVPDAGKRIKITLLSSTGILADYELTSSDYTSGSSTIVQLNTGAITAGYVIQPGEQFFLTVQNEYGTGYTQGNDFGEITVRLNNVSTVVL